MTLYTSGSLLAIFWEGGVLATPPYVQNVLKDYWLKLRNVGKLMDIEKWIEENWEAIQYQNTDFLDEMTETERQEWIDSETESYNSWCGSQNERLTMTEEERKIEDEEMDDFMCQHSLGKYMLNKNPKVGCNIIGQDDGFFNCEFCNCQTNAKMRACCDKGKEVDRI